ncbi:SOS response-associated peptidase [Candidatus Gracilibacteria bacterium]|nr:SOS response-associated peptidase [Candidatus Gracilibacteria bacterium]
MCGRYTLKTSGDELARQFELADVPQLTPRYNIAPTQEVPVVRLRDEQHRLDMMRWGLIPSWAKDRSVGARMINARAETLAEKPSFRTAFRQRRCLVPADGFYEWLTQGKSKQPYHIHLADSPVFGLAGLWEFWRSPQGEPVLSCTIITTAANELMQPLHDRMPVIIPAAHYTAWLDPQQPLEVLSDLLQPYSAEQMRAYAVSPFVSNANNEGEACIASLA